MFLLPATQSTLSLELLLAQLEQSPSPKQGWVRVVPLQLLPHLSIAALSNWCCWKQGFPHCMEKRNPDEREREVANGSS